MKNDEDVAVNGNLTCTSHSRNLTEVELNKFNARDVIHSNIAFDFKYGRDNTLKVWKL